MLVLTCLFASLTNWTNSIVSLMLTFGQIHCCSYQTQLKQIPNVIFPLNEQLMKNPTTIN